MWAAGAVSRCQLHSTLPAVDWVEESGDPLIRRHSMQRLKELTIVTRNEPGRLARVLDTIARRGVLILAINSYPGFDLNTVRLVVSDTEAVRTLLNGLGFAVTTATVLGIRSIVKQGRLSKIIDALAQNGTNVDYLYGCAPTVGAETLVIIHVSSVLASERALKKAGFG